MGLKRKLARGEKIAFFRVSDYSKLTAELHNTREFRRGGDNFDEEPHNAHVAEQLRHNNITGSLNYNFISPDAKHRFNSLCFLHEGAT